MLAHDKQVKSFVKDTDAENNTVSSRVLLAQGQDELISKIKERISARTFLPKENGEDIQILRCGINESSVLNFDYYHEGSNMVNAGNRVATVLMYLSTVPHDGKA